MRICEPRPITPSGRVGLCTLLGVAGHSFCSHCSAAGATPQAIEALVPTVQGILSSGSEDVLWIECTLDQLLNHACIPEGLTLFKTLSRHYWQLDPQATAGYINAYRDMWDGDDQNDTAEVEP